MAKCHRTVNDILNLWDKKLDYSKESSQKLASQKSQDKSITNQDEFENRTSRMSQSFFLIDTLTLKIKNYPGCYDTETQNISSIIKLRESLINTLSDLSTNLQESMKELNVIIKNDSSHGIHQTYLVLVHFFLEKIDNLLTSIGSITHLNSHIFEEDQHRVLQSNSSIILHCITAIWTFAIKSFNCIFLPFEDILLNRSDISGEVVSSPNHGDNIETNLKLALQNFGISDCFEQSKMMTHTLTMDLLVTSWFKYNRLMRGDDLLEGTPFLCACNDKLFKHLMPMLNDTCQTTEIDNRRQQSLSILPSLLELFMRIPLKDVKTVDQNHLRLSNVMSFVQHFNSDSEESRAYFVVWHLYALQRVVRQDPQMRETGLAMIRECRHLFTYSYGIALKPYASSSISPHNSERMLVLHEMKEVLQCIIE